jgi:hypothetical protein
LNLTLKNISELTQKYPQTSNPRYGRHLFEETELLGHRSYLCIVTDKDDPHRFRDLGGSIENQGLVLFIFVVQPLADLGKGEAQNIRIAVLHILAEG